jgi:ABC-type transport system substrate-binding protein
MAFGFFSEDEVDALIEEQRTITDLETRKEMVQRANQLTSDKVASVFLYHPANILVYRSEVNYPDESRIPGLTDLDRVTLS